MIAPIQSISQLQAMIKRNPKYGDLLLKTAEETGSSFVGSTPAEALAYLESQFDEVDLVDELNARRGDI